MRVALEGMERQNRQRNANHIIGEKSFYSQYPSAEINYPDIFNKGRMPHR